MNDDKKQQEFHLRDYWQVLVRRRWIVVTCVVVTTVAAAVSSYLATPIYRATARISIERQGVRIVRQTPHLGGAELDRLPELLQHPVPVHLLQRRPSDRGGEARPGKPRRDGA
ncbi:MAG: Wzz/FepE/Etk N-terminal domain-containing protein [Acidobacteriota bacterium]|nr:Wzz/FepE/Etk N-terminal domain-containing protein [Acidobacteriota bacterium]